MKEERIKFYRPRKIALIGITPIPGDTNKASIELFHGCERWMVGVGFPQSPSGEERIEAILGKATDNECHPCVIKDMDDNVTEVELIVRYKEEKDE